MKTTREEAEEQLRLARRNQRKGITAEEAKEQRERLKRQVDAQHAPKVTCKFCGNETPAATAHAHQGKYVGECCWDERLRATE